LNRTEWALISAFVDIPSPAALVLPSRTFSASDRHMLLRPSHAFRTVFPL